jgi:hypothetical protein
MELPENPDSMSVEMTSIEYAVHLTAATGRLVSLEQADRFLRINKLVQWSVEGALQRAEVDIIVRSTGGWLVFGENARDHISPTEARKWLICLFFFYWSTRDEEQILVSYAWNDIQIQDWAQTLLLTHLISFVEHRRAWPPEFPGEGEGCPIWVDILDFYLKFDELAQHTAPIEGVETSGS